MSFPEYSDYECSGFDWLGLIPRHWRTDKFRYVFTESNEKIENEVVGEMLSVSGYRGIEIKIYDDDNKRRTEEELQGYRIVRPGQLVVNTMWLNYAGLGVSNYEGHVSPAYRSYWINADVDLRFIHHLMRSSIYVQGYTQLLTGIRPNSLQMSRDDLMGFPVVLAPRAEQTQIARFLDHETAKIDALIREQERLIELLQEKRQAVISHAVTKGLDPDVPMKDSGVEWLGEVPAHWAVTPFKRCSKLNPPKSGYLGSKSIECTFLPMEKLKTDTIRRDETREISEVYDGYTYFEDGDVLCAKVTPCFENRNTALASDLVNGIGFGSSEIFVLRPETGMVGRFLFYRLLEDVLVNYWTSEMIGAGGLKRVPSAVVENFAIALPDRAEQKQICAYLDTAVKKFEELMGEAQSAVALLKERRSALVSAAVTGKIDVRNWEPPADESAFDEEVRQTGMEATA